MGKIVSRVKLLVGEKYWSGKDLVTKAKFSHFSPTFFCPDKVTEVKFIFYRKPREISPGYIYARKPYFGGLIFGDGWVYTGFIHGSTIVLDQQVGFRVMPERFKN